MEERTRKNPLTAFYVVRYNQQEHHWVCVYVCVCVCLLFIYLFWLLSFMALYSLLNSLWPPFYGGGVVGRDRPPFQNGQPPFLPPSLRPIVKPLSIIRKLIIKMLNLTTSFVLKYVEATGNAVRFDNSVLKYQLHL